MVVSCASICLTTTTIHPANPAMPSVHQNVGTAIIPRLRAYTERSDQAFTGSARSGRMVRSGKRRKLGSTTVPPTSRRAKSQSAAPLKRMVSASKISMAPGFTP